MSESGMREGESLSVFFNTLFATDHISIPCYEFHSNYSFRNTLLARLQKFDFKPPGFWKHINFSRHHSNPVIEVSLSHLWTERNGSAISSFFAAFLCETWKCSCFMFSRSFLRFIVSFFSEKAPSSRNNFYRKLRFILSLNTSLLHTVSSYSP